MAKIFNFYLKNNISGSGSWDELDMFTVANELKLLFDKACRMPETPFTSSDYWFDPSPEQIANHGLSPT